MKEKLNITYKDYSCIILFTSNNNDKKVPSS